MKLNDVLETVGQSMYSSNSWAHVLACALNGTTFMKTYHDLLNEQHADEKDIAQLKSLYKDGLTFSKLIIAYNAIKAGFPVNEEVLKQISPVPNEQLAGYTSELNKSLYEGRDAFAVRHKGNGECDADLVAELNKRDEKNWVDVFDECHNFLTELSPAYAKVVDSEHNWDLEDELESKRENYASALPPDKVNLEIEKYRVKLESNIEYYRKGSHPILGLPTPSFIQN